MTNTSQEEKLKLILTQEEAEEVFSQGRELVVFYLLELSKRNDELERRIAELERRSSGRPSSTPSGMIPPYEKAKSRKRGKKPGRKPGHAGSRRARPPKVDRTEEHRLEQCPHCQNPVDAKKPARKRRRIIEDLQESETEAVEHLIHGCWCPVCKKIVEPQIIDALPKSTVGHRAVALTAWLHYGVGITLSQILEVLNHHFHFQVSAGGLVQMWYRIQAIFHAWYEQIEAEAREASYLHADESGWRVNGSTDWLWCFTNEDLTYYMIDESRGAVALQKFFGEEFGGCLITDFWRAYDLIRCEFRQYCLAHLLREIHDVDARNESQEWQAFSKRLRRLIADALRLCSRKDRFSEKEYESRNRRLDARLEDLVFGHSAEDADVKRLTDRLARCMDGLLTFLDHPEVSATNNRAEREIRPAVIIRKRSLQNRSQKGAQCQAVFMSIYRTLKLRGLDPIGTMVTALKEYVRTGSLPPLPAPGARDPP